MKNYFEIVFLREAFEYLQTSHIKHSNKILYNIRKAQQKHDPELFKKLTDEIWKFRTFIKDINTDF